MIKVEVKICLELKSWKVFESHCNVLIGTVCPETVARSLLLRLLNHHYWCIGDYVNLALHL